MYYYIYILCAFETGNEKSTEAYYMSVNTSIS